MKREKRIRRGLGALCLIFCLTLAAGCTGGEETTAPVNQAPIQQVSYDYLDTVTSIAIYDSQDRGLLTRCFEIIADYEDRLSRTLEGTEIYRLNETGSVEVEDDVLALIRKGLEYSELSGGAFDITVEPITSLWDFQAETPKLPDAGALAEAVKHVGYENLTVEGNTVSLADPESGVDLGAIAKGYIADRLKEYLESEGVKSALINLGGNVLCIGSKPDGSAFNVGLHLPFAEQSAYFAVVQVDGLSVVTSGIDQRNFEIDDKLYYHILDTQTGYPCESGLVQVTILSPKSVDGDGLSTTCFALGLEKGLELIDSLEDVYAIFVTDDYDVVYSEGLREAIPVIDGESQE